MSRGLVLGKFLPPHAGHLYLVETALAAVDELAVVVGTLAREPIDGALRFRWMQELVPRARVIHLTDDNPQEPAEHPDFWAIWEASLRRVLPWAPDVVFGSEPYVERLAAIWGAEPVIVDVERAAVPVSGTAIRDDPMAHWHHLPRCVRPHFVRRVSVFGPESTGKTTLAAALAKRFDTVWVPEYARTHLEARQGRVTLDDMVPIARRQRASEEALARAAHRVLVCDTDPRATALWSDALFGEAPPAVHAFDGVYDLTLLLDVDVPFVDDPVRYLPHERAAFFARCEAMLRAQSAPFEVIRGPWDERLAVAVAAVERLLRG